MAASLEETLISVWRQVLVEDVKAVRLESQSCVVRHTSRSKLREVDFRFENKLLRGLEQNPNTGSRWAELARAEKKVMQFLDSGRYVANVVDGEVKFYGRKQRSGWMRRDEIGWGMMLAGEPSEPSEPSALVPNHCDYERALAPAYIACEMENLLPRTEHELSIRDRYSQGRTQ